MTLVVGDGARGLPEHGAVRRDQRRGGDARARRSKPSRRSSARAGGSSRRWRASRQRLVRIRRTPAGFERSDYEEVRFVPLDRRRAVSDAPALGLDRGLLGLGERVRVAALAVVERLQRALAARRLTLLRRDPKPGQQLAQRPHAPDVTTPEAPAQATRPARRGRRAPRRGARTSAVSKREVLHRAGGADLVPGHRRRDGRPLPRAQRVDADRGLARVVLASSRRAPCPRAWPWHAGRRRGRAPPSRAARRPPCAKASCRSNVTSGVVERHVDLHPLRARASWGSTAARARRTCPAAAARRCAALHDGGRRARVEVEGEHRRVSTSGDARERRVQLEVGEVGQPDERRLVVDDESIVFDVVRTVAVRDPLRPVRGRVLLVEERPVDAVRVALEGQRAALRGAAAAPARSARSSR